MKVISLCDGISVAQAALIEAGYEITSYLASEIEKNAIAVTQRNYPNTVQIGDITQVDGRAFGYQDFLFSGTPCPSFSVAGKQTGFEDPRGALFWHFVRILGELREANPNIWFLFENVIMKEEFSRVITKALGVSPIRINSNLISAQNRDRFYWTNIPYFWPPADRGIMLKDIIHENTDGMDIEKYKIPITRALKLLDSEVAKRKVGLPGDLDNQSNRVYSIHGKAITLSGAGGGGAVNMGQYLIQEPHGCSVGGIIDSEKHPALSMTSSGNTYLANLPLSQSNRLTDIDGKSPTLNANATGGNNMPIVKVPISKSNDGEIVDLSGKARTVTAGRYEQQNFVLQVPEARAMQEPRAITYFAHERGTFHECTG